MKQPWFRKCPHCGQLILIEIETAVDTKKVEEIITPEKVKD